MTSWLLVWTQMSQQKGVYSIRKEFAPGGSKFFPYRADPISEESKGIFNRAVSLESIWIPLTFC